MTRSRIILTSENIQCTIDPQSGGRVSSLIAHGRELLVTQNGETNLQRWGCYPMAPYAGRVRNGRFSFNSQNHQLKVNLSPNAIHGTVFDRPCKVVESSSKSVTMQIGLGSQFGFNGSVTQTISLERNVLSFVIELHTTDAQMPGQVGWHPWFARPCRLESAFEKMYVRDEFGIPTGARIEPIAPPYDDCFTGSQHAPRIIFDEAITVTIDSDCSHWVIYDQTNHAICVEPQSGPPDGFNLEPLVITPTTPLTKFMRLSITK